MSSSSAPTLTVKVIDEDPSSRIVEEMVRAAMRSAECVFPDLEIGHIERGTYKDTGYDNFVVLWYEDIIVAAISVMVTIFFITFIVLDIRRLYSTYRYRVGASKLDFIRNHIYSLRDKDQGLPLPPPPPGAQYYYDFKRDYDFDYEEIDNK